MRKQSILVVAIVVILLAATNLSYAVTYQIIELGTLGGTSSLAYGINDYGQVVGWSFTSSREQHGFLWDSVNGMQDLGTLGGGQSVALSINNSGQVVGYSKTSSGRTHAFLWDSTNGMQDLGVLLDRVTSFASGINNHGQVVGYGYDTYLANRQAFLWDSINGLQTLNEIASAMSINDSAQVAGHLPGEPPFRAAIWDSINGVKVLGTPPGGRSSWSLDINNSAQVVGLWHTSSREQHGFLWDSVNGMQDLGTLGGRESIALSINDAAQVVGYLYTNRGELHAFLWDSVNGMQDLGTLGGLGSEALGINNSGQIVGSFITSGEVRHAILLNPGIEATVDIRPGSCPNPLNVKSKGVLPVAILGSEDFDVNAIVATSVRLAGVAPIRDSYEDVATPVLDANECECIAEGPDGFLDLTLKFETQAIVEALGEVEDGDEWVLELNGTLCDETEIVGEDCIIVRAKTKAKSK